VDQRVERLIFWDELRTMVGGVSRSTWNRAIRRGEAPAPICPTRGTRAWTSSSITAWLASHTPRPIHSGEPQGASNSVFTHRRRSDRA
jgi:predicted DNA-binding transcriptional regulator AlpA